MRLGYEFSQSPSSVGSGTSSVTVTARIYVKTKASVYDSNNSYSIGGSFSASGSVNISHGSGGGTTLIRTLSRTVSTSYSGTVSTSVSASLSGIAPISGTASVSGSHSTAKRPYSTPSAPSNVRLSLYGSGGRVTWARRPTSSAPYESIELNYQRNNGSWESSATLSGGSSSYVTGGFASNADYQYRVRARNSSGVSSWAYSNTVRTQPDPPAAPSNANVTRSSDTRHVVSWTRGSSSTAAPITQQEIRRWDKVRDSYITIATVSGSVSSFTDSTTVKNQQYRYAVRSKNSSGTSSFTYTPYIATTPAPPTKLAAKRQGADVQLNWSLSDVVMNRGVEVWITADGADGSSRDVLFARGTTSWTHVSPDPTKTYQYRLKAGVWPTASNETGPSLWSAFSARSNTVQLLAPPNAPTGLKPSSGAVDGMDDAVFSWVHNSADTTSQTAYELQYRVDNGAWVGTGKVVSGDESLAFPADTFTNGTVVEWQVRTWGDHASASPWSQIAVVTVSARPSATIIFPDGSAGTPVVLSSSLAVEWEYFDPESTTQTAVRLRLDDANGAQVWAATLSMASTIYEIPYVLADGASYTVSVSVRDAAGLWSYDTSQDFNVTYAKPPAPSIEAVWDQDLGGVVVSIEHPAPSEVEAEAVSADLQHSADGEEWQTIAAGLDPTTSTVDFIPVLDTANYYRVISYSALPSSLESAPVPVNVESKGWVFVNGGPDWSVICRIRDNVQTSHDPSRSKTLNHFAGRQYPVMTAGEARNRGVSLSGRTSGGGSTDAEWEYLLNLGEPVCYREPGPAYGGAGDKFTAMLQAYSRSRQRNIEEVSMTFERVEEV
ncbi:virion structural protein [Arthrobacter phage 1191A]|nr:virion structural protein [Arthrobacter phage 1191A]